MSHRNRSLLNLKQSYHGQNTICLTVGCQRSQPRDKVCVQTVMSGMKLQNQKRSAGNGKKRRQGRR